MQPRQPWRPNPSYTVPLTSITYAIMAQNTLRAHGIRSSIIRDERYYTGKSCGYALALRPGTDMDRVMNVLRERGIKLAEGGGV